MQREELRDEVFQAAASVDQAEGIATLLRRIQAACAETGADIDGLLYAATCSAVATGDLSFATALIGDLGVGFSERSRPFGAPSLLACAVESGSITMVENILARSRDRQQGLDEALLAAAERGGPALPITKLLLSRGASAWPETSRECARRTPLMAACEKDCPEAARLLLETRSGLERRQYASARTRDGDCALACAARAGSVACVKLLLEVGCGAGQPLGPAREPLLAYGARHGREDLVRYLVYNGAALEGAPAVAAALGGHHRVALFLLEKGAAVEARDAAGVSVRAALKRSGVVDLIRHIHRACKAAGPASPAPPRDDEEDAEVAAALAAPASRARPAALPAAHTPQLPPPAPAPPSLAPGSHVAPRDAPVAAPAAPLAAPPRPRPASAPGAACASRDGSSGAPDLTRSLMEEIRSAAGSPRPERRPRSPSPVVAPVALAAMRRPAPPPIEVPGGQAAAPGESSSFSERRAFIGSHFQAVRGPLSSERGGPAGPAASHARVQQLGASLVRRLSSAAFHVEPEAAREPASPRPAAPPSPAPGPSPPDDVAEEAASPVTPRTFSVMAGRRKSLAGAVETPLVASLMGPRRSPARIHAQEEMHLPPPPRSLCTRRARPDEDDDEY
eukprot:tig00000983_g5905.t1